MRHTRQWTSMIYGKYGDRDGSRELTEKMSLLPSAAGRVPENPRETRRFGGGGGGLRAAGHTKQLCLRHLSDVAAAAASCSL